MAKGTYIEMAHHPQAILDTLDQAEHAAQRTRQQWKLGCGLTLALVGVGALVFLLGTALDYGLFLILLAFILLGLAILTGLALLISRPRFSHEQLASIRQILHTLRDDTGRKGWVAGWLDMTGPKQATKQVRTVRSGGGKQKVYYHDPWFRARIKLVDGNVLRLSVIDKVKTKAGSVVNHRTQVSVKLVINPAVYRLGTLPAANLPLAATLDSEGDGILSLKAEVDPRALPIQDFLQSLKALYNSLEPLQSTGTAPPATS
jgi:hypothetical protein